jgi:hypothetical protein
VAGDYIEMAGNEFCAKWRIKVTSIFGENNSRQLVNYQDVMRFA